MRRVLDHGRWIVVTLLLLGGLVVSSVCSGGVDSERVARLGRLQAFVAAQKKAAQRDASRPFFDLVPAYEESAQLGLAAANWFQGDLRAMDAFLEASPPESAKLPMENSSIRSSGTSRKAARASHGTQITPSPPAVKRNKKKT